MASAVLVFMNQEVVQEVKKRGLSIKMTELERPPVWKKMAKWFEKVVKEYDESSLLVDYEGPHEITYSHTGLMGLPDWLPKLERDSGTSVLHSLKKLQDLNDESALFLLYRKMRMRTPAGILAAVEDPAGVDFKDACYPGKVIKVGGIIRMQAGDCEYFRLTEDGSTISITCFSADMNRECSLLLDGKLGVTVGIVSSIAAAEGVTVRCGGLFIEE
ncbi:MAG: hypothetical protein ABIJ00_09505 [Candidatus Eisenbacteria bacterium]